jgi:hypothetical protein
MEPKGSLPNLKMPATWPCPKLTIVLTLDFYGFFIPYISFCFVTENHCILLLGLLEAFKKQFYAGYVQLDLIEYLVSPVYFMLVYMHMLLGNQ